MAITFPDNPTEGQELTWGDYVYRYTRGKGLELVILQTMEVNNGFYISNIS